MKLFKLTISVFFLLIAFQQTPHAETALDQIQILINEGHLQQALDLADQELAQDDSDIRLLFLKGLIYTKMEDLDNAERLFEKITSEHPELPEPFNNLAVIYAFKGEFDKAELALLTAINTHPTYATAHENLGDIYAKMATQAYNQALELDQENIYVKEKLLLVNELFSMPESSALIAKAEVKQAKAVKETRKIEKPEKKTKATPPPVQQKTASIDKEKRLDDADKKDVTIALNAWANAWSSQDLDAYLASYASEFVPPKKLSRKSWEAQRKNRLESPQYIKVDLSAINVVITGKGKAQVTFTQRYESDTYSDRVKKEFFMVKSGGKWLIAKVRNR
jgi:tetratricopeptide (TPR) repeat protein